MGSTRTQPKKRGEGQWGLGYFEPLNPAERAKRDDDGLNVRARIEATYSKHGFRSIDKTDLRSRFRWWGLYTQRKQGIPGGATASVKPSTVSAPPRNSAPSGARRCASPSSTLRSVGA